MPEAVWKKAIASAPVPERARHALAQLRATEARKVIEGADAEQARILSALWSGSEWAVEWLAKHPEWLAGLKAENLSHPRRAQGMGIKHFLRDRI